MAKSPRSRESNAPVIHSYHLPAHGGAADEAKQENAIAWQSSRRDDRIDNERAGMDLASGLLEGDLSSTVATDTWMPDQALHERSSLPFVGQWNRLVSQTNWEKGRLIVEWRSALEQESAPVIEYSDEAWSRLVGGVTSQHVGRLRRVYIRFAQSQNSYSGLFWSHFHAAVEWEDAELWLQGALEHGWSVSQMRHQRWETLGKIAEQKPDPRDVVQGELDEDLDVRDRGKADNLADFESSPKREGPDFGEESGDLAGSSDNGRQSDDLAPMTDPDRATITNENSVPAIRPFEQIGDLPEALADLVEELKLSIIRYKADGWQDVSRSQMLAVLDGLRHLVESESDLASAAAANPTSAEIDD